MHKWFNFESVSMESQKIGVNNVCNNDEQIFSSTQTETSSNVTRFTAARCRRSGLAGQQQSASPGPATVAAYG